VVIENITRHIENGMRPMQAALKGADEIGFTVLSMSVSLIAVFIPILMMGGIVGRLFREFAVVLSVSIAISMVVSLTATPMMCSRLLRSKHEHGWLYNRTESIFQWVISTYGSALEVVLDRTVPMMLLMLVTIGASVYLYIKVPKGFFPHQDTGRLSGIVEGQQHISYRALVDKAVWFEQQVRSDPDVETVDMVAGTSGGGFGGNQAQIWLQLKPVGVRKSTVDQVIDRLRAKTENMPGATLYLQANQDIRIGGGNPTASINIRCRARISICSANGRRRFCSGCANFLR
jgi:multidrug efflux pump